MFDPDLGDMPYKQEIKGGFLIFCTLELLSKAAVHRVYLFVNHDARWNSFDAFLVAVSAYDAIIEAIIDEEGGANMSFMRISRLLKLTKVLRLLRAVRFIQDLQSMSPCAKCSSVYSWRDDVISKYQSTVIVYGLVSFIAAHYYARIFNSWADTYDYSTGSPKLTGVAFSDAYRYICGIHVNLSIDVLEGPSGSIPAFADNRSMSRAGPRSVLLPMEAVGPAILPVEESTAMKTTTSDSERTRCIMH